MHLLGDLQTFTSEGCFCFQSREEEEGEEVSFGGFWDNPIMCKNPASCSNSN